MAIIIYSLKMLRINIKYWNLNLKRLLIYYVGMCFEKI